MEKPCLAPQLTTPDHEFTDFNCNGHYYPLSLLPWGIPVEGYAEGRAATASRSHCQAEKRRRDRINARLATLRNLIPKSEKMDKAALLASVVEHVKDMKSKAAEISKVIMIPTDIDEVTIDYVNNDHYSSSGVKDESLLLKASVCCDDRPELFSELNQALKSLRLTILDADMISLGGRIKCIFLLCASSSRSVEGGICMNTLKQSLKLVLSRIVRSCSPTTGSSYHIRSRKYRLFFPSH